MERVPERVVPSFRSYQHPSSLLAPSNKKFDVGNFNLDEKKFDFGKFLDKSNLGKKNLDLGKFDLGKKKLDLGKYLGRVLRVQIQKSSRHTSATLISAKTEGVGYNTFSLNSKLALGYRDRFAFLFRYSMLKSQSLTLLMLGSPNGDGD